MRFGINTFLFTCPFTNGSTRWFSQFIMFACYLALIAYFKSRGGYRQVHLADETQH